MREGDGYGLIRVRVKESKNESAMTKIYRSKCRIAKFAIYREKSRNFHITPQNFQLSQQIANLLFNDEIS